MQNVYWILQPDVKSSWKCEGDTAVYRVEVPFDAEAEFLVEGMELQKLGAGTYVFEVKE